MEMVFIGLSIKELTIHLLMHFRVCLLEVVDILFEFPSIEIWNSRIWEAEMR